MRAVDLDCNMFNEAYSAIGSSEVSKYYSIEQLNNELTNSTSATTVLNYNIHSIKANGDTFVALLQSLTKLPQILVITETWLNSFENNDMIIDGFEAFNTVRIYARSGGVSVYVHGTIRAHRLVHLSVRTEIIESCVMSLCVQGREVTLFAIYRPHSGTIDDFCIILQRMLHDNEILGKTIILIGDMNINLSLQENNHVKDFTTIMQSLSFLPVVTRPTRFDPSGTCDPSLLDHIWVNDMSPYISGIINYDITDHCPAFYSVLDYNTYDGDKFVKFCFSSHKPEFRTTFKNVLLTESFDFNSANRMCSDTEYFCTKLDYLYCQSFPMKTKYVSVKRISKPLLASAILQSVKTKANYFKMCKLGIISSAMNKR